MTILLGLFMQVQVHVSLPAIRFEVAPPLVEVQTGVFVVPDYDEEVFFVEGWYWVRSGDERWYRARDYHGGWAAAQPTAVPVVLVQTPRGRYKHHKAKQEKWRVANADGSVTQIKVKEKHGVTEVKVKEKKEKKFKKGKWR